MKTTLKAAAIFAGIMWRKARYFWCELLAPVLCALAITVTAIGLLAMLVDLSGRAVAHMFPEFINSIKEQNASTEDAATVIVMAALLIVPMSYVAFLMAKDALRWVAWAIREAIEEAKEDKP